MSETFGKIDSEIKDVEVLLSSLKRDLANTDRWWESKPNVEAHTFNPDDRDDWLKVRASLGQVGGSEIGTVAGHNHYTSAYALFCEKVGLVEPKDISDKESVKQGHDFEQKVAERFEKVTGKRVHEETCIFTNKTAPHLQSSIDRKIFGEESGLECKTVKDVVMRKFPQGDFPLSYYDQCASYLRVTELKRWYLAMLVFGTDFKVFLMTTVKEEEERYSQLKQKILGGEKLSEDEQKEWDSNYSYLEACYYISQEELDGCEVLAANFMARVEAFNNGVPNAWPLEEIDGSDSTTNVVRTAIPVPTPKSVVTFDEANGEYGKTEKGEEYKEYKCSDIVRLCERRDEVSALIDELEEEKKALENQMGKVMQDKEEFKLPGWKVTFKVGSQRETCSAQKVKDYFAAMKKEVPSGLINLSEAKRGVRFYKLKH